MLLRSAVVVLNGIRTGSGSVLNQFPRRIALIPNFQIHWRSAKRSSFQRVRVESKYSQLKIPFVFTVATGSLCVVGNQHLGKLISPQSKYDGQTLTSWWNSRPDWMKVYCLICGSCIAVFSAFRLGSLVSERYPALWIFMNKYFVTSALPTSPAASCAQLILSAFSHINPLHLGINMFILYNVAETMVPEMGKDSFLGAYLFCAVASGFCSLTYQLSRGHYTGSVGASGAILGLLGMVMYTHPEYNFYIIFLPFLAIPARVLMASLITMDLIGVIQGWRFFDHAGHLGGMLSGLVWNFIKTSQEKETGHSTQDKGISSILPRLSPEKKDEW